MATANDTESEHSNEAKMKAQVATKWLQVAIQVVETRPSQESLQSVQSGGVTSDSPALGSDVAVGTLSFFRIVFVECLCLPSVAYYEALV